MRWQRTSTTRKPSNWLEFASFYKIIFVLAFVLGDENKFELVERNWNTKLKRAHVRYNNRQCATIYKRCVYTLFILVVLVVHTNGNRIFRATQSHILSALRNHYTNRCVFHLNISFLSIRFSIFVFFSTGIYLCVIGFSCCSFYFSLDARTHTRNALDSIWQTNIEEM